MIEINATSEDAGGGGPSTGTEVLIAAVRIVAADGCGLSTGMGVLIAAVRIVGAGASYVVE